MKRTIVIVACGFCEFEFECFSELNRGARHYPYPPADLFAGRLGLCLHLLRGRNLGDRRSVLRPDKVNLDPGRHLAAEHHALHGFDAYPFWHKPPLATFDPYRLGVSCRAFFWICDRQLAPGICDGVCHRISARAQYHDIVQVVALQLAAVKHFRAALVNFDRIAAGASCDPEHAVSISTH